jgi:hypothetical protein
MPNTKIDELYMKRALALAASFDFRPRAAFNQAVVVARDTLGHGFSRAEKDKEFRGFNP